MVTSARDAIRTARSKMDLRPRSQVVSDIRRRVEALSGSPAGSIEWFAASVGRLAVRDLTAARSEADIIRTVESWVRASLCETVDERRAVVSQLGSAILAADLKEDHEPSA